MAEPKPSRILRLRGRLVRDPASLSAPFPYGGTVLGLVRSAAFVVSPRTYIVRAEEFGDQAVEALWQGDHAVLSCVIRDYDTDAILAALGAIASATANGVSIARTTASAGALAQHMKILFVPQSEDLHPMIYLPAAHPVPSPGMEMRLSANDEVGLSVSFWAVPDTLGRVYQIARKADIVL